MYNRPQEDSRPSSCGPGDLATVYGKHATFARADSPCWGIPEQSGHIQPVIVEFRSGGERGPPGALRQMLSKAEESVFDRLVDSAFVGIGD